MSDHDEPVTSLHHDMAMMAAAAVADAVLAVLGPDRDNGEANLDAFLDGRAVLHVTRESCMVLIPEGATE